MTRITRRLQQKEPVHVERGRSREEEDISEERDRGLVEERREEGDG